LTFIEWFEQPIIGRHVHFSTIETWEGIILTGRDALFPIPWNVSARWTSDVGEKHIPGHVHTRGFFTVFWLSTFEGNIVSIPEIYPFLGIERTVFGRLEGAGTGEANAFSFCLGDIDNPSAICSAISDSLHIVYERHIGETC